MATTINSLNIHWQCKHTWKRASYNTSWCLLGCSIGDLGTIFYFQTMGIDWPVQSPAGCAHALLSFQEGKLTFSTHGCIKREATFRLRPRSRGLWRQKEAINPVPTIIWELSRTFLVENY